MKSRNPMVVEVYRGQVVESVHHVMMVFADARGLVTSYCGNIDYVTTPRSSIKMLQAIPLVESGALEKFSLDDKMLAMACSSHRGEKQHLTLISQWMEKIKLGEGGFHCGPAMPAHEPTAHDMIKRGIPPNATINNCSGKHLGLITTCLALGENPVGYFKMDHPSQIRLRKVLTEVMKIQIDKMPWGIDGCGIPTYAVPLQNIAIGMTHLLANHTNPTRKATVQRILDACRRHPVLLSGSDDFVSIVNEKTKGRCILKSGAEGVYTGLVPDAGQAFVIKIHDGNKRAAELAAAFALRKLNGLTDQEFLELRQWTMPEVKNSRNEKVGELRIQHGV